MLQDALKEVGGGGKVFVRDVENRDAGVRRKHNHDGAEDAAPSGATRSEP